MSRRDHTPECGWNAETERCTCGALVLTKAYRFSHGGVIAFDQHGKQMPWYQDWNLGAERIKADFPNVEIRPGEMI